MDIGMGLDAHVPRRLGIEHQPEIGLAVDDPRQDVDIVDDIQRKADARIIPAHGVDGAHDKTLAQRIDQGDADVAAAQPLEVVHLHADAREILLPLPGAVQQHLAGGGRPQTRRQAFEQGQAQLGLRLEDLAIDRGGRDIEVLGRFADRAQAGDLGKIAEKAGEDETHGRTLF